MRNWIPLFLLVSASACDGAPETEAPVNPPTAAAAAEPPKLTLPTEEHALRNTLPDLLPESIQVIVATSNPGELASKLGSEPDGASTIGQRLPELEDLHPSRLAAYGIDPSRPAGVFYGNAARRLTSNWGVFGHIKDVEKTISHLEAEEQPALASDGVDVKRYRLASGPERLTIIGDVALVTHLFPATRGTTLAANDVFQKLSGELDFGALATAYVGGDDPVMVGLGVTEAGFAVRAVAADEGRAQAATQRWFEHLYDLDLEREAGGILAAMMFGAPTEEQLKKNKKLRKAHDALEETKEQLEVLEQAPTKRRKAALVKAFGELETERVDHEASGEVHVVTSFAAASPGFASRLMTTLADLDFTEAELIERKKLQKKHDKLRDDVGRMSSPFATLGAFEFDDSKISDDLGGLIGSDIGEAFGSGGLGSRGAGLGGGGTGEGTIRLGGIGRIGGGSGYGRGGDFTRPTASIATASDPLIREHAGKRVPRVERCYRRQVSGGSDFVGTVTANVAIRDGKVNVANVSGPKDLSACVSLALQGAVDTEAAATGTVSFRMKK